MRSHQGAAQVTRTGPHVTRPHQSGPHLTGPQLSGPQLSGPDGGPGADGSRRILIVDDEPNIRSFIGRALSAAGYQTGFAGSGSEGLRHALDEHYDLVILDLVMP